MRVTTLTEYSLIISLHLAKRRGEGRGPIAARELAETERLPGDYVEQILLRLRRAGLVDSVRGAKGGYLLSRDPEAMTVYDVMSASDHQTFELNCATHPIDGERCGPGGNCSFRPMWGALKHRIDDFLTRVTLSDLMRDEVRVKELVTALPQVS
jgi:Rrf2 family protein